MDIPLAFVTQTAELTIDPSALGWKHQSTIAEFASIANSGLPAPFGKLFIKRLAKGKAPGHMLLVSAQADPLRCTPIFFGYKQNAGWHYYVYSLLNDVTSLDRVFGASQYRQDRSITRGFVAALLRNAATLFEEINLRGYFYADFCYKNLMGNPQEKTVLVIDMDSCYPLSVSNPPGSAKIDQTWWRLYYRAGARSNRSLNTAMVVGMAVVLCAALASFECLPGTTNLANTVLRGRPEDQNRLFDIFDNSDLDAFRATYHTAHSRVPIIPQIFELWGQFMKSLQYGDSPDWPQVRTFTRMMLTATGAGRDGR